MIDEARNQSRRLSAGVLGTWDIVFMVVAAAAPMAVVVALLPMAFAFGNGGGATGAWLAALASMWLFAVGYVRIVPHVRNAGAFYAYISASIGREWGLGSAYVAAASYFALSCSTLAGLAYFTEQFCRGLIGWSPHWSVWAFASILSVCCLSYRHITLAAKVLAFALVAETLIILLLDLKILYDVGLDRFAISDLSPARVLTPGLGITAIYAFNSMIGIEGTAIYQEEARDRNITIPRATYLALTSVGLFYVCTAWCLTSSVGSDRVAAVARTDPGIFVLTRALTHFGPTGAAAVSLLALTSSFAAALALFNNSARYLYALARDGVIPEILCRTHPKHHSPHIACLMLGVALVAIFTAVVAMDLDPLVNVSTALVGVGSVGLMGLLGITAISIPIFFARRGKYGLAETAAPTIAGVTILAATALAFIDYSALTGVDSALINHLPYGLLLMLAFGAAQALRLKFSRPERYLSIAASQVDKHSVKSPSPQS